MQSRSPSLPRSLSRNPRSRATPGCSFSAGCHGHRRRAAWYFKIYRPKHQQADQPEEDDGGEYPGYDEFEDDGPPWDEEDETEEKEEIR